MTDEPIQRLSGEEIAALKFIELRHRWLVAERRSSGSGWCMHDGDHATLHEARTYVERLSDLTPTARSAAS